MTFTPYGRFRTRADELMKQVPISRINYLMNLPADAPVRLYSYQGQEAWDKAEACGYWAGDSDIVLKNSPEWHSAYQWIYRQMERTIPDFSGDFPMWAWTKRPSAKPKPARYRGTGSEIRLSIVVPRRRILFSNFETWHSVLNGNFICKTEAEWDAHCELFPIHQSQGDDRYREKYYASVEPSWQGCLSFAASRDLKIIEWSGSTKYFRVQACVDRFYWDEIKGVRLFPDRK